MPNIKRNLFYNFLLSGSQVLVPLVSIPYVSRMLDPEGIGKVGFIDSFTYYFVVLAEAGIMVYGIREVARVQQDAKALKELVSELISLHLRTSLISILIYGFGVWMLWSKIGDIRLLYFSFSFLLVNAWACEWYFLGRERFGYIAFRSLFIRLAGLAGILLLIHQPDDYYIYYAIIAGSAILTGIWNFSILLREVPVTWKAVQWKKHLGRVWVTYLITLLYSIPLYLDHVLLRLVSTASAVGFYSFSVRLLRVSTSLISDSFLVFFPRVAFLHAANDKPALQQKLEQNFKLITLLSIPMGMGIFLLSEEITFVFFGPSFSSVQLNLQVLALYPILKSYSLFLSNPVLMGHHLERIYLRNLVVSSLLFLFLALLAGFWKADLGICVALLMAELVLIGMNYFSITKKLRGLNVFNFTITAQAVLASLLFIPLYWAIIQLLPGHLERLLIIIPVCAISYLLMLLFAFRNHDIIQLMKSLSNIFRSNPSSKK